MGTADLVIFFAYLLGSLALGLAFARRQRREGEFLLAGRSMRWLPIGLSVMATAFSAMNVVAFSTEVATHGLYVLLCLPVFVLVAWPVTRVIMPFYHAMGLTSAYEYLERRFDVRVRCLASGLFIGWRVLWMAVALYVPSLILSRLLGWHLWATAALTGLVATAYTAAGGMRAVMWTDVAQVLVLFGGLAAAAVVAAGRVPGGFIGVLRAGVEGGLAKPFHPFDAEVLSLDPTIRITLWSCVVGTFVAFLARYGADQVVVQRYFTARSLRDAQRGFWLNVAAALAALLCLAVLGFVVQAHWRLASVRGLLGFSHFVRLLPAGLCGLVVAGLFAASMSSVDSGIHSCSTALVTDFLGGRRAGLSRVLTAAFGVAATVAACTVDRWGPSLFAIANRIINGLGAPLLALFLLGMFSRRANTFGMLVGGLLGAGLSVAVSFGVEMLALHYYAVANLLGTLALCTLCSLLAARPSAEQLRWTWWERRGSG